MQYRLIAVVAATLAIAPNLWAAGSVTLIHAGELLAVPGQPTARNKTIVVEADKIVAVRDGFVSADSIEGGAVVIDLSEQFVLPGLMDMHVHLQGEMGPHRDRDALRMSDQLMQMRSIHYAMNTLRAGFTTVRDVGSSPQEMYALRDAINKGWIDGPRIIAAGGVGITGGHADVSGVSPDLMDIYTSPNVCDGPYDCRRAARNVIKYGADLVKITSTGGVMTDRKTGTGQQMEMDELREIVLAAARMGRKVASHAHEEDGIVAALEAASPASNTAPTRGRGRSSCSGKRAPTWSPRCLPERPWRQQRSRPTI